MSKGLFKSEDPEDGDVEVPAEPKWKRNLNKVIGAATKVGGYMTNI